MNNKKNLFLVVLIAIFLTACGAFKPKYTDSRKVPIKGAEKARKNIEEGRGISLGSLGKNRSTNFEFSSSNPLWRASLEVLDFMPLQTVDYSGGMIVTDWYGENHKETIKISIRFLSNEIKTESLKIIAHKKICNNNMDCRISNLNKSKVIEEIHRSILVKATSLQNDKKSKKK